MFISHQSVIRKHSYISNRILFHSKTTDPRLGWRQNIEHPHTLVSLSSVFFFFFFFFFCQRLFNFIGKARFRRATLSCDSSYCSNVVDWFVVLFFHFLIRTVFSPTLIVCQQWPNIGNKFYSILFYSILFRETVTLHHKLDGQPRSFFAIETAVNKMPE